MTNNPINKINRASVDVFAANTVTGAASLNRYQAIATQSAFYPGQGTALGLAYCALKLNGEAGELAEHVGKAMRDDGLIDITPNGSDTALPHYAIVRELTPERKALIVKECGDVLWYVSALANELGLTLSQVALQNLEKLCSRGERDTQRGSGDDR